MSIGWLALPAVALAGCAGSARGALAVGVRAPGCDDGVVLAGACVPARVAAAYCGKAAVYRVGGCVPLACPSARPRDEASGACLSPASLREAAHDIELDDEHLPGCREGKVLFVGQGHARCIDQASSCGRGSRWMGTACGTAPTCPPGQLADGAACVSFVRAGGPGAGKVVDIGVWVRLTIGPDGGTGSPDICAPITRRPWLFTGMAGPTPTLLKAQITLVFPDNDVTRVHAQLGLSDGSRHPAPQPAAALLEESAGPLVEALRAAGGTGGGVASAASVTTTVTCHLLEAGAPVALP